MVLGWAKVAETNARAASAERQVAEAERRAAKAEAEAASERALNEVSEPLMLTAKLLAFRQHIETLEQNARDRFKKARETWKLVVVRDRLVANVLESFSSPQHLALMWRRTYVTYVGEEGEDAGGLTADLHASFWREVLQPEHGIFERLTEGGAHLPRSDADGDALRRVGRMLLKSVLDDHPTGPALSSFVLEFICGAHEARAFRMERPRDALRLLAACDADLAQSWTAMLNASSADFAAFGLTLDCFDDSLPAEPLAATNVGRAVVAGCRRKLLVDRHAALVALREGFTLEGRLDLGVQLAQHSNTDLSLLLQGKPTLSAQDLLDCFDWSDPCCAAVTYLRELLQDAGAFDATRRQLLLRWCTGRNVLPVSGLGSKVTFAAADVPQNEVSDGRLPEASTCFHEVRLPSNLSKDMLRARLDQALDEFALQGGFGRQ